jgi:hypothetical protein
VRGYLEAVVLAGDASGIDEELSERFEDAVAVGGAEVEVLVGEDVGDVVDDRLVHLLDDVGAQDLPHDPHARRSRGGHLPFLVPRRRTNGRRRRGLGEREQTTPHRTWSGWLEAAAV